MVVSPSFRKDLQILAGIDPENSTITLLKANEKKLLLKPKEFSILNFCWRWFIHIISLTFVSRNPDLDRATQYILKNAAWAKRTRSLNSEDKDLLERAIKKLQIIVEENNGSKGKKVAKLLSNIQLIQSLDCVKELIKNEDKPHEFIDLTHKEEKIEIEAKPDIIPEIPLAKPSNELALQNLLNALKDKQGLERADALKPLLIQINGSVELSKEQTEILCLDLRHLKRDWVIENAKKMSPNIIRFLVEQCFKDYAYEFPANIFEGLIAEPVSKEHLKAWVHAFPAFKEEYRPQETYTERVHICEWRKKCFQGRGESSWFATEHALLYKDKILNQETIQRFEKSLDESDVNLFIRNFFGLVALAKVEGGNPLPNSYSLEIANFFQEKPKNFLLKTLCYTCPAEELANICFSHPHDEILETIFKLNPEEGKYDSFFSNFVNCIIEKNDNVALKALAKYVFRHETEGRQKDLLYKLSSELQTELIEAIPQNIFESQDAHKLLEIANVTLKFPKNQDKVFALIAKAFEDLPNEHVLMKQGEVCHALLPFFSDEKKQKLLSYALRNFTDKHNLELKNNAQKFIKEAEQFPIEMWEEASKTIKNLSFEHSIELLPQKQAAAVLNGQIKNNNQDYNVTFFEHFFGKDDLENQANFVAMLKPAVFDLKKHEAIDKKIWEQFFKVLQKCPDSPRKTCIFELCSSDLYKTISSDKANYIDILSTEQIKQLPFSLLRSDIRIIFAFLSGKLDKYAGALKVLSGGELGTFIRFFRYIYRKEVDKDQNRTYEPLVNLINQCARLAPQVVPLLINEIKDDEFPVNDRIRFIKKLSPEIISQYVIPKSKNLLGDEFSTFLHKLEPDQAKSLIELGWDQITKKDKPNENIPYAFILKMVSEGDKLKALLREYFDPNFVGKIMPHAVLGVEAATAYAELNAIFSHLEKHPWKLVLMMDDESFNTETHRNWLHLNDKQYPECKKILQEYAQDFFTKDQSEKLTQEIQELNRQFKEFFRFVSEKKFEEAVKYPPNDPKRYLCKYMQEMLMVDLCKELPYMNDGQIFYAACYEDLNKKLQEAIQYGKENKILSENTIQKLQGICAKGLEYKV